VSEVFEGKEVDNVLEEMGEGGGKERGRAKTNMAGCRFCGRVVRLLYYLKGILVVLRMMPQPWHCTAKVRH
jgi:hypothetical protein